MAGKFTLRLFGGFRLSDPSGHLIAVKQKKAEAVIAYLALQPDLTASRERLATLLWGDSEQSRARQSLRQILFVLARAAAFQDERLLLAEGPQVSLDADRLWVDVRQFQSGLQSHEAGQLREAIELYRGDLLDNFHVQASEFEVWESELRVRLQEQAIAAAETLLEELEASADHAGTVWALQAALRIDPYREDLHRRLMQHYIGRGMRSSAIAQFRKCRDLMVRDLGVLPEEETVALYNGITEPSERISAPISPQLRSPRRSDRAERSGWIYPSEHLDPSAQLIVGREAELEFLEQLATEAADGHLSAVRIFGEQGAGKSHLIEAFLARHEDKIILGLQARPGGKECYGLWRELPEQLERQSTTSGLVEAAPQVRAVLVELEGADGDGNAEAVMPVEAEIARAVRAALSAACAHSPVILACQDLQWASRGSLKLLERLSFELADQPIMILVSYQCEGRLDDDLVRLRNACRHWQEISLAPLTRSGFEDLIAALQGALDTRGLSPAVRNWIWDVSEGNPSLAIEALLYASQREVRPLCSGRHLSPKTQQALSARLSVLSPTARHWINTAAVLGRRGPVRWVGLAAGLDEASQAAAAEELRDAGLAAFEAGQYRFVRERFRYALLNEQLDERQSVHGAALRQAVEASEGRRRRQHATLLAKLCRYAGASGPALRYDLMAGDCARNRGDSAEAKSLYESCLAHCEEAEPDHRPLDVLVDLHLRLADLAQNSQDLEAVSSHLLSADDLLRRLNSPAVQAEVGVAWSRCEFALGDWDQGFFRARQAFSMDYPAALRTAWFASDRVINLMRLGARGLSDLSRRLDDLLLDAEQQGDLSEIVDCGSLGAILALCAGDPGQAAAAAAQASEAAAGLDDRRRLAAALHVAGLASAALGRLESALDDLANAAALAKEVGDVYRLCAVTGFKGFVLLGAGDAAGASAALVEAIAWAEKFGPYYLLPLFRAWQYAADQRLAPPQPDGLDGRSLERLAAMSNWPLEPWLGEPDFSLSGLSRH